MPHEYTHYMKAKKEQKGTVQNNKKGTEGGQTHSGLPNKVVRRLPKTHEDYWFSRLRQRGYSDRSGQFVLIPEWQVRLKKDGREAWFNLGTPNKAVAAKKAKEIFTFLEANRWEPTLAKFKPDSDAAPKTNLTIGDYLITVRALGHLRPPTFLNYQNCLRTIANEAFGIKSDKSKYDYRSGGNQNWIDRIDHIRLERLTPDKVTDWQRRRIKEAGHSPTAIASAKRTANSYVRCARSLFTKEIIKRLKGVKLPDKLPFDEVELFESGTTKYVSKVDVQALIAAAKYELKPNKPEVYKVFLLGLFAGMRRAEIDLAEWAMVDWRKKVIRLEETDWLHLKTHDSAGEITIDAEVVAELRELMPTGKSRFIINSDRQPRNDSARPYYRCDGVFDQLNEWLRSKGVTANKPLHELRKEIGALIATEHGIYAASRFLRHSDITTTARHYAEHKTRISVGLGKLLDTDIKPAALVVS
jgi:integrase